MRVDIAVSSPPRMEADFRAAFYASDKRDPGGGGGDKNGQGGVCDMRGVCTCILESKKPQAGQRSMIDIEGLGAAEE